MFWVLKITSVLALICIVPLSNARRKIKVKHGPSGMNINESTTCEEFAKYARFNPYSVLDQPWFVFYYWGPPKPIEKYVFTFPSANHTKYLHKILDGNTILPINWKARQILMENQNKEVTLLVERGDRGQYWGFILHRARRGQKIRPRDIRLKQTGDNKLLGLMDCDTENVIAMCKLEEVPPKNRLQDEAARLGYRARRGKSYLYQGHEWMPIPEADDKMYWAPKKKERSSKQSSNESNEVVSTSNEETDIKTDETSNVSKEQIDDQSSQEQVDKESDNQKNPETSDEINNNEISEELVEENDKRNVTSSKDEQDSSLPNNEKNDKNNQTKQIEEENIPKNEEAENKPKQVEEENKPKQGAEENKPRQEEEKANKPKQEVEENKPNQGAEENKPKQSEEENKPKLIQENNKLQQKEEENKPKQVEETNKPKQKKGTNKPKLRQANTKPKQKQGQNKPKQKQGKSKPKQKGDKNKQKRSQIVIEPEVITAQEEEDMKLTMTSEPYSAPNSNSGKDINLNNKDSCKTCFTMTQRRRQSTKANLELEGPEAEKPLENQPNPQGMETIQENKASNEVEQVNDDSKDINTDKNEV